MRNSGDAAHKSAGGGVCVFYCGVFLCVSRHFISGASSFRPVKDPEACPAEGVFMMSSTDLCRKTQLFEVTVTIRLIM